MYRKIRWIIPFPCIYNSNIKFLIINKLGPNVLNKGPWVLCWVHFLITIFIFHASFTTISFANVPMNFFLVRFSASPPWKFTLSLLCARTQISSFSNLWVQKFLQNRYILSYCCFCHQHHYGHSSTSFVSHQIGNELILHQLEVFSENPPCWWYLNLFSMS